MAAHGPFDHPDSIAVASDGSVWVLDTGSNRVVRIDGESGTMTTVLRGLPDDVAPSAHSQVESVVPANLRALARGADGSIAVEGEALGGSLLRVEISPDGKSMASVGGTPARTFNVRRRVAALFVCGRVPDSAQEALHDKVAAKLGIVLAVFPFVSPVRHCPRLLRGLHVG